MQLANIGSRSLVMHGKATRTVNGKTAANFTRNSKGRIVLKTNHASKMSKRAASTRRKTHRPVTRSMTAATKSKRAAALVKARAARGAKKSLSPIRESGSKRNSKSATGGFFSGW